MSPEEPPGRTRPLMAVDGTHSLDGDRGRRLQLKIPVRPDQLLGLLRDRLARTSAVSVRVACGNLSEVGNLIGSDPLDFLRRDVIDRAAGLTLLHQDVAALDELNQRPLDTLVAAGAKIRLLPWRLPCLAIVGSDFGLLNAVVPPGGQPVAIGSAGVIAALHRLYGGLWSSAVDFAALSATVRALLSSPQLVVVLRRLCSGTKDETAARQMGVSLRTYRRYIAAVLRALDVTSRIEAGLRVSELGLKRLLWLEKSD